MVRLVVEELSDAPVSEAWRRRSDAHVDSREATRSYAFPESPVPADEGKRHGALRAHDVLDAPRQPEFDAIVAIASRLLAVPMVKISFVDTDRQWFLASAGLGDGRETPRNQSFCAHAIMGDGVFVVPDASSDQRFSNSPLVKGELGIRFYAGAPLIAADGSRIGALCAMDTSPREFDEDDARVLSRLAATTMDLLELRKAVRVRHRTAAPCERELKLRSNAERAFISNMSHEVCTPLHGIIGMLEPLLEEPMPVAMRSSLSSALEAATRLRRSLDDVLDIARLEGGQIELASAPFDPATLVDQVAGRFRERAAAKALTLKVVKAAALPSLVLGDAARLHEVLAKLVDNAVKFTSDGEVSVSVSYERLGEVPQLVLSVADTGIGIEPTAMATLFRPFSQGDSSSSRRFGGTGLGLSISREILRLAGGRVTVRSTPGSGSTFEVRVPAAEARAERRCVPFEPTARSLRILVADDEPLNRRIMKSHLERMGHVVTAVGDGEGAVVAAASQDFDIALLDNQMPLVTGEEAARRIRKLPGPRGNLPMVVVTASADRERLLAAGFDDYLAKPFRREDLARAMEDAQQRRAR